MTRPTLEVADILRAQGDRFLERYRSSFGFQQLKAFRAILRCRTAALGGHRDACLRCGYQTISYNSCRNRHCPKCQAQARERWLTARQRELLDTSYFHVVFTIPHELNVLALENPRVFYDLLFIPAHKPYWTLHPIRSTWEPRSVSSPSSTPGDRTCSCIPTFTVSFPQAGSRWIIIDGSAHAILSSYPSKS
jgi:predicted Zn-ribbon and HTH transcriptional regulator